MSVLEGGKFGNGFISAGFAEAFNGPIGHLDQADIGVSTERVFAAAIVGGTASELGGGKFANGAITGAFCQAFNDEKHQNAGGDSMKKLTADEAAALSSAASSDALRIAHLTDAHS